MQIRKLAGAAEKVLNRVSQGVSIIAVIALLSMMLLTVTDVFLRYVFREPITGSVELGEYLIVVAGFLGVSWCAIKRGHLKVDLLVARMPPRTQAVIDGITLFMGMTVVPLVAWQFFERASYAHEEGLRSFLMHIPEYIFYDVAGVGYALFFLAMIPILVEYIRKAIGK